VIQAPQASAQGLAQLDEAQDFHAEQGTSRANHYFTFSNAKKSEKVVANSKPLVAM
jgi:hypothetical protein